MSKNFKSARTVRIAGRDKLNDEIRLDVEDDEFRGNWTANELALIHRVLTQMLGLLLYRAWHVLGTLPRPIVQFIRRYQSQSLRVAQHNT
jgi:hypothetical protein